MGHILRVLSPLAFAVFLLSLLTIESGSVSGSPVVRAYLTLYSNYVSGQAQPGSRLALVLKDSEHREKGQAEITVTWQGGFGAYLADARGNAVPVLGGDTLEIVAAQGDRIVIPVVPLVARADWTTNRVFGQAPPNAFIEVNLVFIRNKVLTVLVSTPVVGDDGHFEVDYTGRVDLAGGDHGSVAYRDANGNIIRLEYDVPLIKVQEHGNLLSGTLWHDVEASFRLLGADGAVRTVVTATTGLNGDFWVELRDRLAYPVLIQPADRVEVHLPGVTLPVTVVPLTAHADPVADRITGLGPLGSPLEVQLYQAGVGWKTINVSTDADGKYLASFGPAVDIKNGDYGNVNYNVELKTHHIAGRLPYSTTATIRLMRASGEERASVEVPPSSTGSFDVYLLDRTGSPVTVQTGDIVQMIAEGAVRNQFVIPWLTTSADPVTASVEGIVAPGSPARVDLLSGGCTYVQEVVADDRGAFLAPFRYAANPTPGDYGFVYWHSVDGNAVFTRYDMAAARTFLPLLINKVE